MSPWLLALTGLSLVTTSWSVQAQTTLSEQETQNRVVEAAQQIPRVIPGVLTIDGQRIWNSPTLAAQKIVFKPGASLIFSADVLRQRRNLFIFANQIVSDDQEHPGTITWQKSTPDAPPPLGTASPGADNGAIEGLPGGNGVNGRVGTGGTGGRQGPDLTITAKSISPALVVDLLGGNGGPGGTGENGGRGGGGGKGNPASQNVANCNRGAGDGERGGTGGSGGPGGSGGSGGDGGSFTMVVPDDQIAVVTRILQVKLGAGTPGGGGQSGAGGGGGPGGPGGQESRPYCRGNGSQGPTGGGNGGGPAGPQGAQGQAGTYFVGGLNPNDIDQLLK